MTSNDGNKYDRMDTIISHDKIILFSRFQSFCGVCLWVSLAATSYAFGIFSQTLRYNLNYSQQSLDIIASCGNSGLYLSFIVGMSIEYYGYKSVIFFGSSCLFIGFVYIYLVVIKIIPSTMATVALFYCISQIGACCLIASAVTVSVKLFPSEARGAVLGLCKGYFGLSSAILGIE
jgi:hypothetical protein